MVRQLIYQMFSELLGGMALRAGSDATKEMEVLAMRRQLAVLRRHTPQGE